MIHSSSFVVELLCLLMQQSKSNFFRFYLSVFVKRYKSCRFTLLLLKPNWSYFSFYGVPESRHRSVLRYFISSRYGELVPLKRSLCYLDFILYLLANFLFSLLSVFYLGFPLISTKCLLILAPKSEDIILAILTNYCY